MDELLKASIIRAILFSAYDRLGPTPIYMFPKDASEEEAEESKKNKVVKLTYRDYVQISIKNLSLLIGDRAVTNDESLLSLSHFGVIPYPDFNMTSLTFFHFIRNNPVKPIASSLSVLVDENKRNFLFNNVNRIRALIPEFFQKFDKLSQSGYKKTEEVLPLFKEFLLKLIEIEQNPSLPITSERKMKILFAGLDDSGKTSFLLTLDRKYSKLLGIKPTRGAMIKSIDALGSTIFLWDLGGQSVFREKYLTKSNIYLYEADLLFYFIDIKNRNRFEESINYFKDIYKGLELLEQITPTIFIFSKGDSDIVETDLIQNNIDFLKSKIKEIVPNQELEIYVTSIFSISSILRAFSAGVSKLSPNKALINHNLKNFSSQFGSYLTLLLSVDGLVLADYYSNEAFVLTKPQKMDKEELETPIQEWNLRSIFEITAPQFTMLYKIFSEFRKLQQDEAVFKIANSVILFKKVQVANFSMFILFLIDDEDKKEIINRELPNFLKLNGDLLIRYIA